MKRKVYAFPGKKEAIIYIQVGRAHLELDFEKGCLDRKKYRPATYATSDPTRQAMIEDSDEFKKGRITLYQIHEIQDADEPTVVAADPAPVETSLEEYADVTSFKDAAAVLKGKGATALEIKSLEAIKANASKYGVSFPNLK